MTAPKAVKPKPKKPAVKKVYNEPLIEAITEEGIRAITSYGHWVLKLNGELLILSGAHTFKCSWSTDGRTYAVLYPDTSFLDSILQRILMNKNIREWLIEHSKRKVPAYWTKKEDPAQG